MRLETIKGEETYLSLLRWMLVKEQEVVKPASISKQISRLIKMSEDSCVIYI